MSLTGSRIPLQERAPSLLNEGSFTGDDTLLTAQDAFNITGAGVINFLDCTHVGLDRAFVDVLLVIDGVTVFSTGDTTGTAAPFTDLVADFSVVYPNGIPFQVSARAYMIWSTTPSVGVNDGEPKINWEIVEL